MSHADVMAAIVASGGCLVASFVVHAPRPDPRGRAMTGKQRPCSGCGEFGHNVRRCNGPGNPPKLTWDEQRRAERQR